MLKVSQGSKMLAERGRFPSGGPVPFDVAESLIDTARMQALEEAAKVCDERSAGRVRLYEKTPATVNAAKAVEAEECATAIRALGSQNDG